MFKLHDIYSQVGHRIGQMTMRRLILAFIIFFIPIFIFGVIASLVLDGDTINFDSAVLLGIYQYSSPTLNEIILRVTNLGGVLGVLGLGAVAVGIYLWRRKWQACVQIIAGIGGAGLLNFFLKLIFSRDRPELWDQLIIETNHSFPSGHAMLSSALAFSLVVVLWHTKWRWVAFVLATIYIFAIGFTRLYLGVHYPTDVVAGWCVSAAWVLIVAFVLGSISWQRPAKKA